MVIGLLGAQNSHAAHFLETINRQKRFPGVSIQFVYGGDDPETAAKLVAEYQIEACPTEEEVIEKSDAVVITYRKGSLHYNAAMKALRAGKAVFNDKPFALENREAQDIVDYAKDHNLLVCGGSNMKGVPDIVSVIPKIQPGDTIVISFSADPESEYEGYFFYGIHSVELCLMLCGRDYKFVSSVRNGKTVISTLTFPENNCVIMTSPEFTGLSIAVVNKSGMTQYPISLAYESVGPAEFVTMLQTGRPPRDLDFYTAAVKLINEIIQSAGL